MELRHLRYFVAAAEAMNITKAARDLNVAQPALSQQIKMLETEIGARLFCRAGRGVELTAAGQIFLEDARAILARTRAAIASAQQVARGERGRLVIGLTESASFSPNVTEPILRFRTTYPLVGLELLEGRSQEIALALAERRVDVALLRPPIVGKDYDVLPIVREPLVAGFARDHAFAAGQIVSIADLEGMTLIWPKRRTGGGGVADRLFAALESEHVRLASIVETAEFITAINMAAAGLGVALVPKSLQRLHPSTIVFRPFSPARPIMAEVILVTRSETEQPAAVLNFRRSFEGAGGPAPGDCFDRDRNTA